MQRIGSRILKSVKKFIIPASAISIISDSNSQKDIKAIYKKFVQSEISVTSFNLFNSSNWNLRLNEANKFIFNRISFGRIDVEDKIFSIYFHFIPFDDYLKIKDIPFDEATDENVIIFSLKDYVDIDQLIKLEKRISTNGYFFLPPPLNCYNCSFIEGCRWSDYPCNAVNLSRMVIDEDFLIRPCIFGEPIGKIYENREKLIEKLRDLKKREERKRGCERCEIKESCSRCLFPSPLTSKDFCTIRKKHANIPEIIRFFDVRTIFMHSANNNSLEGLEKSNLVMRLNDRESNYDRRYIQNKSINEKCGEEKNLSRLFTVQNKDQNIRLFYYKDMMYTFNLKSNSIRKFSN
jgi:radical SAM protein with 4Fe4S-binding SPASM domain